jgi:ATP-dependent Clp protease adaptor protein ClpS
MPEHHSKDPIARGELKVLPKNAATEPKLFKVIIHNDNYTTMDFVVEIIIQVFHKPAAEATKLMLEVHKKGSAIAGIYPYDIALTKVNEVHALAKKNEFPLRCSAEEA